MFINIVMEERGERESEWVGMNTSTNIEWRTIRIGMKCVTDTINNGHQNATEYQGIIFHP